MDIINRLKEIITPDMIIICVLVILLILFLSIFLRSLKTKKARKELETLENKYTELKNVPLSFKLNKAQALAKVSKDADEKILDYQKEFDQAQELLKQYSSLLAEVDDLVFSKKPKKAGEKVAIMLPVVNASEEAVRDLNKKLDDVLEQESTQRENINSLKEEFRSDKARLLGQRGVYHQSVEFLDSLVVDIENMFSVFEEWMFASEFNKAADKQVEIKHALEDFEKDLDVLPGYYEQVKVTLPGAVEELEYLYSSCKAKGVYLKHLDVEQQINIIKDMISEILEKLCVSNITGVQQTIDECEERLVNLKDKIDAETVAFESIHDRVNSLFERIKVLNGVIQKIKATYDRVYERFGFENWNEKIIGINEALDSLNEQRFRLEKLISENSVPYTTLLISCEELELDTVKLENEAKEMNQKLERACSDEVRAKKQLIKLQLIVNEIRIKISRNRLPSVSEKYDEDIIVANTLITDTRNILNVTPLDVDSLNDKLQEAIDYIYTLYNNVNNLVGMAVMVENAIVFGNKYRSEFSEVDSELTRAELCFTNGQYTRALKIAIAIIEKLHPGVYENMITKGNAATNG